MVTFFYDRKSKADGVVRQARRNSGEMEYFVNARGKLPQVKAETSDEYKGRLRGKEIGALVVTQSVAETAFTEISGGKLSLPSRVFKIGLSGGATAISLDFKKGNALTVNVQPWEHLVVPVDAEAEAKFGEFIGFLKNLPESHETSILQMLRRPSLDWRLTRIEETLGQALSKQMSHANAMDGARVKDSGGLGSGIRNWIGGSVGMAALCAVLGVLLGAVGLMVYQQAKGKRLGEAPSGAALISPRASPNSSEIAAPASSPPDPATLATLEDAYKELVGKMSNSNKMGVTALYTSHNLAEKPWNSTNAAVALVKVELLRGGDIQSDSADLMDVNTLVDSKRKLPQMKPPRSGPRDNWAGENTLSELQFFSCQAYKPPKLLGTIAIPTTVCKSSTLNNEALQGLQELTSWVSR